MKELKSGKYSVVAKEYENERMPLEVEISDNKIQKITPQRETTPGGLEETVFTEVSKKIIDNQSLDVDAVTGATHSSNGLIKAVEDVIEEAGGDKNDFHKGSNSNSSTSQTSHYETLEEQDKREYAKWREAPKNVVKEINTDFLIVGAGIAGLAAAVQAGEQHVDTLVLDKNGFVAGNGGGVEGILGINSVMQQKEGIHAEPEDIISKEMELGQYRVDGSFWVDLINNSADNIKWLLDNGVQLTSVGYYNGTGMFPTFHWFKGGFASVGYVPYMKKRADEYGVKFMLNTSATSIIEENGTVKGVYAKTPDGMIKINAKATLISTDGVGHNPRLLERQGWSTKNIHYCSMPSNTGDGYQMAMSIGAKDMLYETPEFMMNYIKALPHDGVHLYLDPINGFFKLPAGGPVIWVNQNGRRFVNENVMKYNLLYQRMAIKSTKVTYAIFNQKLFDDWFKDVDNHDEILANAVKTNEGDSLYKSDTIDGLAKAVNLPEDQLVKTVEQYNKYAKNGKDEEFKKDPDALVAIDEAPYYIARLDPSELVSVGSIGSNQKFEVVDKDFDKIPGLYVAGMDSAMQYRDVYTITLAGSACAHNVNSGRHAAMNAKEYIESL